jgi:hypothetical protein
MSTEPVIHRKQCRVLIIRNEQRQTAPAPAIAETKADRPVLSLKSRPPAAAPSQDEKVTTADMPPAIPRRSA